MGNFNCPQKLNQVLRKSIQLRGRWCRALGGGWRSGCQALPCAVASRSPEN